MSQDTQKTLKWCAKKNQKNIEITYKDTKNGFLVTCELKCFKLNCVLTWRQLEIVIARYKWNEILPFMALRDFEAKQIYFWLGWGVTIFKYFYCS